MLGRKTVALVIIAILVYLLLCTGVFGSMGRKIRFHAAYKLRLWSRFGGEGSPPSGAGSKHENTRVAAATMPYVAKKYKVRRLVDAGGGDFTWMNAVLRQMKVKYTLVDLVTAKELVAKYPQHRFIEADITTDSIPYADLAFVKDVFIHLSNAEIQATIRNLRKAHIPLLLASCDETAQNSDLMLHCRHVNLHKQPFSLPLLEVFPSDGRDSTYHLYDLRAGSYSAPRTESE